MSLDNYRKKTERNLILGGFVILFVVGGGLIWFFYGGRAALLGLLCFLSGFALIGIIYLILKLFERISRSPDA
jgi:hypothetical protein